MTVNPTTASTFTVLVDVREVTLHQQLEAFERPLTRTSQSANVK